MTQTEENKNWFSIFIHLAPTSNVHNSKKYFYFILNYVEIDPQYMPNNPNSTTIL